MKKIKFAYRLIQLNLLYWIIYNTYCGWNLHPESKLEENFDIVFKLIWQLAIVIYLMPLLSLYESIIKSKSNENSL
jgi:hypothetical protein